MKFRQEPLAWAGAAVAAVVLVGVGFWGGMRYEAGQTQPVPPSIETTLSNATNTTLVVAGTVSAITPQSVTLSLPDGSTKTFALTSSTQIKANISAGETVPTLTTIKDGTLVSLLLSVASDGSATVQTINVASPVPVASTP